MRSGQKNCRSNFGVAPLAGQLLLEPLENDSWYRSRAKLRSLGLDVDLTESASYLGEKIFRRLRGAG